ncbi:hypothetical protein PN497_21520 [Sphaerospermopsis kisseleviana CS-549]|uniref:CopG-like ribbon-helix-helix domain-containing protein n=1 Tax=Sphaerospermopsis kisseleviana CS-549 TaxID=3021783 RepID=A0ABT4ZWW3_9CYAN|nr:hypothetical protein [Sphaerospermopsis kisseleviana]MDB9443908.1 hypothetical protein [Sphaerospermopsis kisseleviana CS-549]BAZ82978.1 hypothetical protein NIES73_42610 [Sphaerospermopsis kisseleviana NIES-73]
MPSDKPRVTLRLEEEEYKYLEDWASQEFLTVPQLTRVIVKRAIAQNKQNSPQKSA